MTLLSEIAPMTSTTNLLQRDEREYCASAFKSSHNLSVHRMIHTGEKPIQCEICGFTCHHKASLNWHMKKHDADTNYQFSCSICSKTFEKKDSVVAHKAKSHPEVLIAEAPAANPQALITSPAPILKTLPGAVPPCHAPCQPGKPGPHPPAAGGAPPPPSEPEGHLPDPATAAWPPARDYHAAAAWPPSTRLPRCCSLAPQHETTTLLQLGPQHETTTLLQLGPQHETTTLLQLGPQHETTTLLQLGPQHETHAAAAWPQHETTTLLQLGPQHEIPRCCSLAPARDSHAAAAWPPARDYHAAAAWPQHETTTLLQLGPQHETTTLLQLGPQHGDYHAAAAWPTRIPGCAEATLSGGLPVIQLTAHPATTTTSGPPHFPHS
ncbi:unnamed protein product [Coregonus sp. 'balchen']|nr:unnamed protein product [Coregonus sp. 'balchen']